MPLNKETITQAIDKALDDVLKIKEAEETSDVIFDDHEDILDSTVDNEETSVAPIEKTTPDLSTPDTLVPEDGGNTDSDIEEKVEEVLEEAVDLESDYNFFGVDVKVEKDGEKFNVLMTKDGKEKSETLDTLSFVNVLGVIEDFFNELVLEEDVTDDSDLEENSDDVEEIVDEDLPKEEEEEEEEEEELHASLSNLRRIYSDKIDAYFEHGVLAKEMALSLVKEKIIASTVKELLAKNKEKDALIASKKDDLKSASQQYVLVSKKNKVYKNAIAVLSSAIKELNTNLKNGKIKKEIADKAIKKYNSIISNIIKAKKVETVSLELQKVTLVKNAIVASMAKYSKENTILANNITNNKINKRINSIKNSKNILNSDGWNDNKTILANRYDGIEEMSAELLRIAGI